MTLSQKDGMRLAQALTAVISMWDGATAGSLHCNHQRAAKASLPSELCGATGDILNRSYTVHGMWPFQPFQLVMEMSPGTCNLYTKRYRHWCCGMGTRSGHVRAIEVSVREVIFSFLGGKGCHLRPTSRLCRAVDLGANNGWFTLMMLQLGASVVSVEPQTDFARVLEESARLNCWGARSKVINALACAQSDVTCQQTRIDARSCEVGGWRFGNMLGPSQLVAEHRAMKSPNCASVVGLPEWVGAVNLSSVLLEHAHVGISNGPAEIDFIKMDADGPEGGWLWEMEKLMTAGRLRIDTLIVEGSNLSPVVLHRLQSVHGYTCFRLDENDGRRRITPEGWDLLSPAGTIARLDRFKSQHELADRLVSKYSVPRSMRQVNASTLLIPAGDGISRLQLEEELWAVRGMRHTFRMRANLSVQGWVTVLNPIIPRGWPPQWAFTLDPHALEPTHSWATGSSIQPEVQHAAAVARKQTKVNES